MASNLRSVITNLISTIQQADATGVYTYDLSATDSVKIGGDWPPKVLPCVYIYPVTISSEHGTTHTAYERTVNFAILCFVGADEMTVQARILNAADLVSDVLSALELKANRSLGGTVRDVITTAATIEDTEGQLDGPGLGVGQFTLSANYVLERGI